MSTEPPSLGECPVGYQAWHKKFARCLLELSGQSPVKTDNDAVMVSKSKAAAFLATYLPDCIGIPTVRACFKALGIPVEQTTDEKLADLAQKYAKHANQSHHVVSTAWLLEFNREANEIRSGKGEV